MSHLCPFTSPELNSETHTAFSCHAWVGLIHLKDYSRLAYVPTLPKTQNGLRVTPQVSWPQLRVHPGSPRLCDVQDVPQPTSCSSPKEQASLSPRRKLSPFILQITPVQNRTDLIFLTRLCPDQRQEPDTRPLCPSTCTNNWGTATELIDLTGFQTETSVMQTTDT